MGVYLAIVGVADQVFRGRYSALIDWLVDWLISWLVDWMIDWLIVCLIFSWASTAIVGVADQVFLQWTSDIRTSDIRILAYRDTPKHVPAKVVLCYPRFLRLQGYQNACPSGVLISEVHCTYPTIVDLVAT
jgi:hypothetical protein